MISAEPILQVVSATKRFGGVTAVSDLSLSFQEAEIVGLFGPNGAGKSTLLKLISGQLQTDAGAVLLRGDAIEGLNAWQVARRGVGLLFQDVRVFPRLTALENVLAAFRAPRLECLWASIFRRSTVAKREARHAERAYRLLRELGVGHLADQQAATLSFGEQKLVALARLLGADPHLLLLDEPLAGLHPELRSTVHRVLSEQAERGKCVVLVEHDLPGALEIVSRTVVMAAGRVVFEGPPDDPKLLERVGEAFWLGDGHGAT